MQIHGLNKTTLLDYPEHVAAVVFTGGCNFCCPFCHNKDLVLHPQDCPVISEEEIFAFLNKRKGVLSGICITGGEPTLQRDLSDFIRRVKILGYKVKLDTNGSRPEVLRALLEEHLLDYVAMDIKNCKEKYGLTTGNTNRENAPTAKDVSRGNMSETAYTEQKDSLVEVISESIALIQNSGIDYEFRTTVARELHTGEDILTIAKWIAGSRAYYLQAFRDNENVLGTPDMKVARDMAELQSDVQSGMEGGKFSAYTKEEMQAFATLVSAYVEKVEVRGMD